MFHKLPSSLRDWGEFGNHELNETLILLGPMRLPIIVIALNTSEIIIRAVVQLMVASLRSTAGNSADARD